MSASLKHDLIKAGWVESIGLSWEMIAYRDLSSGHEVHATQYSGVTLFGYCFLSINTQVKLSRVIGRVPL
jgi:hypothetical protein